MQPLTLALISGDDDDDDPYGADATDRTHYVFDNEDAAADDMIVLGQPDSSGPASDKPRAGGSSDRWHDGRPVLTGFILDPKGVPKETWWAFPDIPDDWRPQPSRVWDSGKKLDQEPVQAEKEAAPRGAPGKPLSHEQVSPRVGYIH